MPKLNFLCRLLALFCSSCLLLRGTAGFSAPITAAMCSADPRLERRVTISDQKIYLGKLMRVLSEQSGVSLSMKDDNLASGERVAISLRNVPLVDALNAVWSLFSYRGVEWHWDRSGGGNKGSSLHGFAYEFTAPHQLNQWRETVRQQIQREYEDEASAIIGNLHMNPQEVAESSLDDIVKMGLGDQEIRHGMSTFAELAPDVQAHLLQSSDSLLLTPADPASAAYADLHFLIERHDSVNPPT